MQLNKFLILFKVTIFILCSSVTFAADGLPFNNIILHSSPKQILSLNFKDINENDISLKAFKGQLIIINFWATWCMPCKEEMPSLDRLSKNTEFKNLIILPINAEKPNKTKAEKFYLDLKIKNLKIYFDPELNLINGFGLRGVPTTILINSKGEEFARILGEINFEDKKFISWLKKF